MARKGKAVNRRKSSAGGGKRPLLALLLVVALLAISFFLLERFRDWTPVRKVEKGSEQTPHLAIPRHPAPRHAAVSSASVPVVKPKPHVAVVPAPAPKGRGRVAIIIDDMGSSNEQLRELLSVKLPLTFSVIPSLAHAKAVSEGAHRAGAEVMVHMPMEPEDYPRRPLEKVGLLLNMDDDEIRSRVNGYFRSVPFAVGANNHMGSRFTQDAEKMEVVLKVLRERKIFFVDSMTSPASVGYRTARALGLSCGSRQVFLDNVQDEEAIGKQLAQVAAIAQKKGEAIAICHPHPTTIRALQSKMPELARSGITFVHASALVR